MDQYNLNIRDVVAYYDESEDKSCIHIDGTHSVETVKASLCASVMAVQIPLIGECKT